MIRVIQVVAVSVLILGALYYAWMGLPRFNQVAMDERQVEALTLVQSSPAIGAATILEAMNAHVRSMKDRGQGVRLGEWRVSHVEGDIYEIRVQLRDQSVRGQWFEREYIWHAHLGRKKVNAASLPADGVTPKQPDSDQPMTPPVPGVS
ncbi:MAG: hypothetical protein NW202_05045 [Nitrospira sp.]|nr:hypothetical protein [Nitrospira sp.]